MLDWPALRLARTLRDMTQAVPHCRIVWRLVDGKPGHENQTLGLVQAMQRQGDCRVIDIPVAPLRLTGWRALLSWLLRRFPRQPDWPAPDWIVAAGHATHWPMLCAQRACGGRTVVLMKPSLPLSWFDHVVVPEHDEVSGANVISTRGVLNPMRPGDKVPGSALALVGGISKHFGWDNASVLRQLVTLREAWPGLRVTDSRRTPAALREQLQEAFGDAYQSWEQCPPGWLASQLAITEVVWVSEDSVSMIYEALTAGCRTGLLELPANAKPGRLVRGIEALVEQGFVLKLSDALLYQVASQRLHISLQEADRVSQLINKFR